MTEKFLYINRWQDNQRIPLINRVFNLILYSNNVSKELEDITGRTDQGLIDLRGIPFSSLSTQMRLENKSFSDIDFSYANFGFVLIKNCQFTNVILNNTIHQQWNERDCKFTDVDFSDVKFVNAALGIQGSIYHNAKFNNCNFTGSYFFHPQFTKCTFCNSKLKNIDFNASNFISCKFRGKLESIWFRRSYPIAGDDESRGIIFRNEMRDVDFSQASFWDVIFTGGLDLSTVILPKDGQHILVRNFYEALQNLEQKLGELSLSENEKKDLIIWIEAYKVHAVEQPMWILNKADGDKSLGNKLGTYFFNLIKLIDETR
jgi:uncharacterized protein YjbI with pentapeptide repeats